MASPPKKIKRGDTTLRSATPVASGPRERLQPYSKSVQLLSDLDDWEDDTSPSPQAREDTYFASSSKNDDLNPVAKLPDDLVTLHAENLCNMLKRMDDIRLHEWFARVVHPFWATSTIPSTYIPLLRSAGEHHEEIQDEVTYCFSPCFPVLIVNKVVSLSSLSLSLIVVTFFSFHPHKRFEPFPISLKAEGTGVLSRS